MQRQGGTGWWLFGLLGYIMRREKYSRLVWRMLESGIGSAHNIAIASLKGFTLPGDISASSRYFERVLFHLRSRCVRGTVAVPDGVGLGFERSRFYQEPH